MTIYERIKMLRQQSNDIDVLTETYNSDRFSINVRQNLYITKKKSEADFTVAVSKESDNFERKPSHMTSQSQI